MWVKICGVNDERTAEQVCKLGPDAIGLNFHPQSPRFVTREAAAQIAKLPAQGVQRVGVFVNHSVAAIEDLARECRLDAIQFHGDESPEQMADVADRLPTITILRAWRMSGQSLADLGDYLNICRRLGTRIDGCLIDSNVSGAYGGTGHRVPWTALANEYQTASWPPLILAGGLNPSNVADAIAAVHPWGVDVASGVESTPGVKDLLLVQQFISKARAA